MDRTDAFVADYVIGIPHPRGDGPKGDIVQIRSGWYSPPTWGWTARESAFRLCEQVFPTHVGMDRETRHDKIPCGGIPHPRGDGPTLLTLWLLSKRYSPPTWGWTAHHPHRRERSGVFPTHVGMDRRFD